MDYENAKKELTKVIREGKFIIGANEAIKNLRQGKVEKLFVAKNCEKGIKEDLIKYAKLNEVPIFELDVPNTELGILCKKQYSASVVHTIKGE